MPAPPPVLSPSFHHHHFISLSFPQRKIRHTLQKFHFLFFSNIILKLHNLPLHKSGIVCSHNNRYWVWGSYTQHSITSWCKIWDLLNSDCEECYWPSGLCGNVWLLTLNLLVPTIVGAHTNARTACAYIRRRSFGNADSPLFLSECTISQPWRNHESIPVSYLCINT
jgi:hypothetical protein